MKCRNSVYEKRVIGHHQYLYLQYFIFIIIYIYILQYLPRGANRSPDTDVKSQVHLALINDVPRRSPLITRPHSRYTIVLTL